VPYFIEQGCDGKPEWWAVKDVAGEQFGCHATKQDAIDQGVAISLADDEPFLGENKPEDRNADGADVIISDIDGTLINGGRLVQRVWDYVQSLDGELFIVTGRPESERDSTISELHGKGVTYSRLIMNDGSTADSAEFKKLTAVKLLETYNVTTAIENDRATRAKYRAVGINAVNPSDIKDNKDMTIRAAVGELAPEDLVRWINGDDVEHGQVISVNDSEAEVLVWDEEDGVWSPTELIALVEVSRLEKIDALPEPEMPEMPHDEMAGRSHGKIEMRVSSADFEIRETPDGMTFEGYAAVFNSRSENLGGFTEFVAPGAFTRSLKTRNDVKLLWNHDSGQVLGSTRARTLTLSEDARGLKVSALLPNTQLGRDTAELLKRGDVDAMSFGFNVIKDKWNAQGDERTLEAVRLFEVSIVAFPAYSATAGTATVRSLEKLATRAEVDANALEAALTKLEAGEDLDNDARNLLTSVIDKLSPSATFDNEPEQSVVGDLGLLALKKKKIEFLSSL